MANNNFNDVFKTIPLAAIPKPDKIISIPANATLLEAAETLYNAKIQAAPVYDPAASEDAQWHEKYLGIVDLIGITSGVVGGEEKPEAHSKKDKHPNLLTLLKTKKNLTEKKVSDVMGTWMNAPFIPVEESYSLLDAMLLLSKYQIHRLPVIGPNHDIVNIITQTTIVKILQKNKLLLAEVGQQSLKDLGLGEKKEIHTVSIESKTNEAFRLISEKHVGAVGITGHNDMLIGTVSASDIRTLTHYPELFGVLSQSLRTFLEAARLHQPNVMNPAIRCFPLDSLEHVIDVLAATKVHRIFVIDHQGVPLRVISLCDIIDKYVKAPDGYFGGYFVNGHPAGRPGL